MAWGTDTTFTDVEVAHHHLNFDVEVDHDLDADHAAIAPTISYAEPAETGDSGEISA